MKALKWVSPWLGLPGGYFGSVKWVDSVWLQRPHLIAEDTSNPIRFKTKKLPMELKHFLQMPEITKELFILFPQLAEVDAHLEGHEEISLVLTESWHDQLDQRDRYADQIVDKVNECLNMSGSPIFFKRHPGESLSMEWTSEQVVILPQQLPIELLYPIMMKNKLKKVRLFSFGSTAILNLYDLCRQDDNLEIYLFGDSLGKSRNNILKFPRFCALATQYQVAYHIV
jgi:hypothetical protein